MEQNEGNPNVLFEFLQRYLDIEDEDTIYIDILIRSDFFRIYLKFLSLITDSVRSNHELEFYNFLSNCTDELLKDDLVETETFYDIYEKSLILFPRSVKILNGFGTCLIMINEYWDAYKYFTAAREIDKNNLENESLLNMVKLELVPRWYFRILNDIERNKAYCNAINFEITSKYNKVLNLEAGCGVLSVYASRNDNTKQIIATGESECFSKTCEEAINFEKLQVINSSPLDLDKNSTSLSNILVTEILDTGLFDKHVLEFLIHAHENLLEDDFKIIPSSADVYIVAIESPELEMKYWFRGKNMNSLNTESLCLRAAEYTSATQFIKEYNFKKITEPYKFLTIDFKNLDQLKNLYENGDYIPKFDLKAIDCGFVHAFIVWFDLKLGNETITTNPFDDNCSKCLEQVVLFPKHPFHITEGKNIENIQMSLYDGSDSLLQIKMSNCEHDYNCIHVPEDVIQFLNESDLINNICSVANDIKASHLVVLDLLTFPIFGILMAARNHRVYVITEATELVEQVCFLNNINQGLITFLTKDELNDIIASQDKFCDVLFLNPIFKGIYFYGDNECYTQILKENGVILPKKVYIECEVINCKEYFKYCQKLNKENVLDSKIPELLNKFTSDQHSSIGNHLKYKRLTKSARFPLCYGSEDCSCSLMCEDDGTADSILYWYYIDFNSDFNNFHSTKNSFYHKKGIFILDNPITVVKDNKVRVTKAQNKYWISLTCTLE